MYNKDVVSYNTQNSDSSKVKQIEVMAVTKQVNDFGYICIPVDSSPLITAFISNPQNFKFETTVGELTSKSNSVRVSRTILPLASTTYDDENLVTVALKPAPSNLEHTDFVISFVPISEDRIIVENQSRSITLRYNTPPTVPLGITVDSQGKYSFLSNQDWGIVPDKSSKNQGGHVYWAWPKGMTITGDAEKTDANCVASFVFNNRAYTPRECATGETITADDGTVYDIYRLQTENVSNIELYAKDVESIRGKSLVSGVKSHEVVFDAYGGYFEDTITNTQVLYRQNGTIIDLSSISLPVRKGFYLLGWMVDSEFIPQNQLYEVKSSVRLQALWEDEYFWDEVRDLEGVYNQDDDSIYFSWNPPLEEDFVKTRLSYLNEEGEVFNSVFIPSRKKNYTLCLEEENISSFRFQTISSKDVISEGLDIHTITYVLDDTVERVLVQEGKSHPEIELTEKEGYEFKGWALQDTDTPFNLSQKVSKSISLQPLWEKTDSSE